MIYRASQLFSCIPVQVQLDSHHRLRGHSVRPLGTGTAAEPPVGEARDTAEALQSPESLQLVAFPAEIGGVSIIIIARSPGADQGSAPRQIGSSSPFTAMKLVVKAPKPRLLARSLGSMRHSASSPSASVFEIKRQKRQARLEGERPTFGGGAEKLKPKTRLSL